MFKDEIFDGRVEAHIDHRDDRDRAADGKGDVKRPDLAEESVDHDGEC